MITVMRLDDGTPHVATLDADTDAVPGGSGFRWVHCERQDGLGQLAGIANHLPEPVIDALLAVETRPRCEMLGSGILLNLRCPKAESEGSDGDVLVSLRLWVTPAEIVSVSFRQSSVLPRVKAQFEAGQLHDCGDVLSALLRETAEVLDHDVATIGDALDTLECGIDRHASFEERRQTTRLRSQAISLRRFVGPQQQAVERLVTLDLDWFDATERAYLRDAADRFYRMSEELESVRERSAVLHDEITDLRAERLDARSLQLAIVALIFLPLTFITGLLGMNVEGIPYAKAPWAFWGVTLFCALVALSVAGWFAWRGWSRR